MPQRFARTTITTVITTTIIIAVRIRWIWLDPVSPAAPLSVIGQQGVRMPGAAAAWLTISEFTTPA